jgi:hypothetical protein
VPPAPADRDRRVAGSDHGQVAGVPRPGGDRVVDPLVGVAGALAGEDAHRRPARRLGAARGGRHHLAEPAADDGAARLGEQAADLLRLPDPIRAAPDDGDLAHPPMIRLRAVDAHPARVDWRVALCFRRHIAELSMLGHTRPLHDG